MLARRQGVTVETTDAHRAALRHPRRAGPTRRARPSRGLVLVPDIVGLRPLFDDLCARLADEHGWAVVAAEPWPGREQLPLEERLSSVGSLDDRRLLGDCTAAADLLGVEPVAVLGFCMGGMVTPEGRGHRALRPGGVVLRDDPVARRMAVPDAWPSPSTCSAARRPVRRSCHSCGTGDPYVPVADLDALEGGVVPPSCATRAPTTASCTTPPAPPTDPTTRPTPGVGWSTSWPSDHTRTPTDSA